MKYIDIFWIYWSLDLKQATKTQQVCHSFVQLVCGRARTKPPCECVSGDVVDSSNAHGAFHIECFWATETAGLGILEAPTHNATNIQLQPDSNPPKLACADAFLAHGASRPAPSTINHLFLMRTEWSMKTLWNMKNTLKQTMQKEDQNNNCMVQPAFWSHVDRKSRR